MGSSVTSFALRTKITGVCPAAQPYALARLLQEQAAPVWLVVIEEPQQADGLGEDVALFHESLGGKSGLEILHFPESQADHRDMREAFNASSDRLAVLSRLRSARASTSSQPSTPNSQLIILTTPGALLQPVPPLEDFANREFVLRRGQSQSFQALLDQLRAYDYDSEAVCEAPGQYAVRGGIVDVYPITARQPYRLDFFGDTLEDIRALDPVTQRSADSVDQITLTAAPQLHATPSRASLLDHLPAQSHGALVEPKALEEAFGLLSSESIGRARPPAEPTN
ncbi:MAG TPA: transcription-repair coupling factor, partial [Candidatus Didemnitutus sp.]|nr:transcription-repair coupling factor [Candidatus Didemnitutus sp.]